MTDRMSRATQRSIFFFFNDTATTEIYTLSLHDALPISPFAEHRRQKTMGYVVVMFDAGEWHGVWAGLTWFEATRAQDRKSTRLNSSHTVISYAVFCLKKKNMTNNRCAHAARADDHVRRC